MCGDGQRKAYVAREQAKEIALDMECWRLSHRIYRLSRKTAGRVKMERTDHVETGAAALRFRRW